MDNDHKKPTTEQLEETQKKLEQDLEKPTTETTEDESTDDAPKEEDTTTETTDTDTDTEKSQDAEEIKEGEAEEEEKKPDIQKRYVESTRESQVLYAHKQRFEQAVDEAESMPEPTDEELQQEASRQGFTLDDMSNVERALFKKSVLNERKISKISSVAKEGKDIEAWNKKVDEFIDDPKVLLKNPELEGKQDDFKVFATKQTRRGLELDDLVLAFNGELAKAPKQKSKGKMFETGGGGTDAKPKTDEKLTVEESATLRSTNYVKYKELLKQGKISTSVA